MRFTAVVLMLMAFSETILAQKKESGPLILFTVKEPVRHTAKGTTPAKSSVKTEKVPVTTDEFTYLYKKNHTKKEDFSEVKEDEYLTLLINFKLKIAEARQRGLDTTAAFTKEFNTYREELKKPYQAGNDDLDRLTREAYEHLKESVKATHILIMLKPDALPADTLVAYMKIVGIRQKAVAGEDFEKLAREYSEDPSAKQNSGNLGYFSGFQMVYPFEKAAFATPTGSISQVIRTRFGYHILKVFDRVPSHGEVEISHILLRTGTADDAKVKNTIFEIYDQLKAGRPWDELAKQYSEDSNTKTTGGRLAPFGPGVYKAIPEFEQTAFTLKTPGEISDPFQSRAGWHIIRLEKKIPLLPYSEMEASLKRKVARDERLQLSKASGLQKRKTDLGFSEKPGTAAILANADSGVLKGKWAYSADPKTPLFEISGVAWLAGDFTAYVNAHPTTAKQSPSAYLQQLYSKFQEEKLNAAEEAKIIREHPDYKLLLSEYEEGILLFEIMEKEVWNRASEDTAGQHRYYRGHVAKYSAGDRVEVRIFSTPDKPFFDQIHAKIAKGDSITGADIRKFKSAQNKKAYAKGENKITDRINWVPGIQEIEADGNYYLVDVIRLVPPGVKTFEEARASVISDYQDELEKEWLIALRQKYPVAVNKKAKKTVIAELNK